MALSNAAACLMRPTSMTATTSLTILPPPPDDVDNDVVSLPSLMLMTIALMTLLLPGGWVVGWHGGSMAG